MAAYLNPDISSFYNLTLMASGAVTTGDEAVALRKIHDFQKRIIPSLLFTVVALVTGIILALVLSNPILLAVGLSCAFGFSAIGLASLVVNVVRYRRAKTDHENAHEEVKKIYQDVIQYLKDARNQKIADIMTIEAEKMKTMHFDDRAAALEYLQKCSDDYDARNYKSLITLADLCYSTIPAMASHPYPEFQGELTVSLGTILEKPLERARIYVDYQIDEICHGGHFQPKRIENSRKTGLVVSPYEEKPQLKVPQKTASGSTSSTRPQRNGTDSPISTHKLREKKSFRPRKVKT